MELLLEYMGKGLITMLMISMPCVLVAAGVGLVVGILQAVTQVQEQTIAAAPKILGVFMVIIIGGFAFMTTLTNFFTQGMGIAFNVLPKNDAFVLSSDYYKYTTPFEKEMNVDKFKNIPDINEIMKNPGKVPYIDNYERSRYHAAPRVPMPRPNQIETNRILRGQ